MGRRDKERIERIRQGLEDPIARQQVKERSYKGVVRELSRGGIAERIQRLDEMVNTGIVATNRMGRAIMDSAPAEMDKAIRKFKKEGTLVTVDNLMREIRTDTRFQNLCAHSGVPISWFEQLARERMEANGL